MKHLCKTLAMLLLTVLVGLSGLTAYATMCRTKAKKAALPWILSTITRLSPAGGWRCTGLRKPGRRTEIRVLKTCRSFPASIRI